MDGHEWVIDTWVLYQVDSQDFAKAIAAYHLLATIFLGSQHKVAIDMNAESKIERQYEGCFNRIKNDFPRKWWKHTKDFRLVYYSGKLSKEHTNHLIQMNPGLRKDLPFVGVASKTRDKFLVAEESDYTAEVREYLESGLQVQVMSIEEADNRTS